MAYYRQCLLSRHSPPNAPALQPTNCREENFVSCRFTILICFLFCFNPSQNDSTEMSIIKFIITILLGTNLGQSFPVNRPKLPSTYLDQAEECPPGIVPCTAEKRGNVPEPTIQGNLSTAFANTAVENITRMTTATPSHSSSYGANDTHRTTKVPSEANEAGKGDKTNSGLQQGNHPCPIGIWVCRRKRALRRIKKRMRRPAARREFEFAELEESKLYP